MNKSSHATLASSYIKLLIDQSLKFHNFEQHLQKDIVRGIEGFVSTSSKQMDIGTMVCFILARFYYYTVNEQISHPKFIVTRMAEDCCKYGNENQSTCSPLARASLYFGDLHISMEKERETLLGVLCDQVYAYILIVKLAFEVLVALSSMRNMHGSFT